jgi:small Trp-rich protein
MVFVLVGIALIACNLLGYGPMAAWNWDISGDLWKFAVPFALAAAWWTWSDASGLSKRRAMQKDTERKQDRLDRNVDALGLGHLQKGREGRRRVKK